MFSEQAIYIQVEKDFVKFFHVNSGRHSTVHGLISNQRLAIAHFMVAVESLKSGIDEVYPKSFFRAAPVIVMHQIYNAEGGLCEIEERILREVALSAGAKQVFVWQGQPLTSDQILSKAYMKV